MKTDKKLLTIAIAPLIHDNKILLLRRHKPPLEGLWGMPGGKVEFGEHVEEAIKREIQEETGLTIRLKKIPAVLSEVFRDASTKEDYWHAIIFLCEVDIEDVKNVIESAEGALQWFDLQNLPQTQIIPSDYEMLRRIILNPSHSSNSYRVRMLSDGDVYTLDYFEGI